jgi:hypothetical protein
MTTHCMRHFAREDGSWVLHTTVAVTTTTATLLTQAIYHSPSYLMKGIQYLSPKLVWTAPDPAQNHVTCYNRQQSTHKQFHYFKCVIQCCYQLLILNSVG